MSHPPQQPWDQSAPPWGQQQPSSPQPYGAWGQQPHPQAARSSGVPVLVLGLVTAVLGLAGTVLPSVTYPDDIGYFGPLLQSINGQVLFLSGGLVSLVAVGLLVAGSLVQRSRAGLGTGLVVAGAGMVALSGLGQLFALVQAAVSDDLDADPAVGGVLLSLAGCVAVAAIAVGLARLSRLR